MSGAVLRVMFLGLVRDRGALAMTFALPAVFFWIFATIFSGASGESLRLEIAVANEIGTEPSQRLLAALERDGSLLLRPVEEGAAARVRELVRTGAADAGLVIRAGARPLERLGGPGAPPLVIVSDPVRGVAASLLTGQLERAYLAALPEASIGSVVDLLDLELVRLTPEQRAAARSGIAGLADEARIAVASGRDPAGGRPSLFVREDVTGASGAEHHVAYYAGGVAFLFLLFSSASGAMTLHGERDTGILDRVIAGPSGAVVLVDGKFLYLVAQGFVQVTFLFVIAWIVWGVDLIGHVGPWAITTLLASVAAAGFALLVSTTFRTHRQAQQFSNVAILVMSALGGSMVPRFFMPPLFQRLGWITPNTWALEAYAGIFWRDAGTGALLLPWTALLLSGTIAYAASRRRARRLETI